MTEPNPGRSFLSDYVRYQELTPALEEWASQHRDFVRLRSLAKTKNGRDVWLLEVGRKPDDLRPAICIDANMHSTELLGTNAALYAASALIDLHQGRPGTQEKLAPPILECALDGLYYIIPRVSPDGAEDIMTAGSISRSAPRRRPRRDKPAHWIRSDMDGDGAIRQLRIKHPAGELVQHPEHAHVLVPRTINDDGPYFKVFPEGYIQGYDGVSIPFPHPLSDNDLDFNRNFPFDWSGHCAGAGDFPGGESETQAIIQFAADSPNIFAWLNLHTFGGIFIRPPFSGSKLEVHCEDLAVYEHAAELALASTGLPTVSAFEEMTPDATKPMTGTLPAWAYNERGCLAWAIELWDLFAAVGLPKRKPYFRNYTIQSRKEVGALVAWDASHNEGRVFGHWRPFSHPQLGEIEIGGIDPVYGFVNPPRREIAPICDALSLFAIELASFAPRLHTRVFVESISPELTKIRLIVSNSGYLPTYVMAASRTRTWNPGLKVLFKNSGCTLVSGHHADDVGHLRGWGCGANEEANAPFFQKSQGVHDLERTWIVEGYGKVEVEIGGSRSGWRSHTINVGPPAAK